MFMFYYCDSPDMNDHDDDDDDADSFGGAVNEDFLGECLTHVAAQVNSYLVSPWTFDKSFDLITQLKQRKKKFLS